MSLCSFRIIITLYTERPLIWHSLVVLMSELRGKLLTIDVPFDNFVHVEFISLYVWIVPQPLLFCQCYKISITCIYLLFYFCFICCNIAAWPISASHCITIVSEMYIDSRAHRGDVRSLLDVDIQSGFIIWYNANNGRFNLIIGLCLKSRYRLITFNAPWRVEVARFVLKCYPAPRWFHNVCNEWP